MSLGMILLISVILGAIPTWRHSRNWGYAPSSVLGFALVNRGCFAVDGEAIGARPAREPQYAGSDQQD